VPDDLLRVLVFSKTYGLSLATLSIEWHQNLIRNQQVAGSSPAGGSIKIKKFTQNDDRHGWYFGWYF